MDWIRCSYRSCLGSISTDSRLPGGGGRNSSPYRSLSRTRGSRTDSGPSYRRGEESVPGGRSCYSREWVWTTGNLSRRRERTTRDGNRRTTKEEVTRVTGTGVEATRETEGTYSVVVSRSAGSTLKRPDLQELIKINFSDRRLTDFLNYGKTRIKRHWRRLTRRREPVISRR